MKRDLPASPNRKTGRPRAFDESAALERAMLTYWRHGYESTSMAVLATAMGLSAPSIYAAFGDKKSLFLLALDRYVGDLDQLTAFMNAAPSAVGALRLVLEASAVRFTGAGTPPGCMLASATARCSVEGVDVHIAAAGKRAKIEKIIRRRIERDISSGALSASIEAGDLAALTITVIQGMSTLARDGASRKKLMAVAKLATAAWTTT